MAALALAVPAGAAVGQWALGQPGLVDDFQELSVRASDGRAFGWTVGLAFIAVVVIAYVLARVEARRPLTDAVRERVLRVVGWLALGLIVVGVVLFVVRVGNPATWVGDKVDEFTSPELVSNDPARLTSVNANKRLDWWAEAASAFRDEPALGSGAGTFPVVHRLYRADEISVASPHNVLMQFLAETGLVGALLAAVAAAAGVVAAGRAARRLADDQQLAGLALVIILVLYALHALVDVEWDFLAVTAPALLALGVMLGKARALWLERFPILALVPPLVFLPIVVSLLLPRLLPARRARRPRSSSTIPRARWRSRGRRTPSTRPHSSRSLPAPTPSSCSGAQRSRGRPTCRPSNSNRGTRVRGSSSPSSSSLRATSRWRGRAGCA